MYFLLFQGFVSRKSDFSSVQLRPKHFKVGFLVLCNQGHATITSAKLELRSRAQAGQKFLQLSSKLEASDLALWSGALFCCYFKLLP